MSRAETASRFWAEPEPEPEVEPQITIRESPLPPIRDWPVEAPPPEQPAPERRRRLAGALPVAAGALGALVIALGSGLTVWALTDNNGGTGVAPDRSQLVADQARAIAILSSPDATRLPVRGSKGKLVLVFSPTGEAVLVVTGIEGAPSGETYEAWVIIGEDAQPAGLFSGAEARTVVPLTKRVPKGAIVAVTLEEAGGASSPTMKPLWAAKRT